MGDALEHVEAAIAEVTKARSSVARGKSKQVRTADELDQLKALAFAWFKTHRPIVSGLADLGTADESYQAVLDATARFAARSTYANSLQEAKSALLAVRRAVTAAPGGAPSKLPGIFSPEAPPGFASLTADPAMQAILNRRWDEVQQCIGAGANLAAAVMMGGLLETLLLARINVASNKAPIFTAKGAPRDKGGKTYPLSDWKLISMVDVAQEMSWITRSAKDLGNVLRDFRNYIHPHKEHTDGVLITNDDARMFWEVCKAISRQVLGSIGASP